MQQCVNMNHYRQLRESKWCQNVSNGIKAPTPRYIHFLTQYYHSWWGRKLMCQIQAKAALEQQQDMNRDCSSRSFYVDLWWSMQMSSQNLHTEVPMSIPEELPDKHQRGGSPQDLRTRTRTSTTHVRTTRGCHQDLFLSFSKGPAQDHAKARGKISLKSVRRELREMKNNNWTRTSCQDHPGPLRDFHKIVTKGPAGVGADLTRLRYKNLVSEGPRIDISYARTSSRQIQRAGFPQESEFRCRAMPRPKIAPVVRAYICSRHAHGHVTRAVWCENFQAKCHKPRPGATVSLRHHFMRKCSSRTRQAQGQAKLVWQTLCEPAQSKRTWTSHKSPLSYAGRCRKNARQQMESLRLP